MKWILLALMFALTACGSPARCDYDVVGTCEFVTDSYQIRGGKWAILEMMGKPTPPLPQGAMEEYQDTIGEGDILNIALYHPLRKNLQNAFEKINSSMGGFEVKNGLVALPDLPPVRVEGLTLADAKQQIEGEIQKQYVDAEIFLQFHERKIRKVDLIGQVESRAIPINGRLRLFEVLSQANLSPNANLFMSYVLRNGTQLPVDLHALIHQGDMSQNIVMKREDKIFIADARDSVVLVMGEVLRPTAVSLPYGFISLPEALVAAGGIPFTGNKRCILVIRGDLPFPKIYKITWQQLVHLPNRSLLLIPGDTVYVTEKPITRWNRFISQLLPSVYGLQAIDSTRNLLH